MSEPRLDPETLADLLDKALPPGQADMHGSDHPLVNAARLLAQSQQPQMPPEMFARVQTRMLQAYGEQRRALKQPAKPKPRWRLIPLRTWALAATFSLIMLVVGLTPIAANSLPGSPLYPAKRAFEHVELALANSDDARAEVYARHAEKRALEALLLLGEGTFDSALIQDSMDDLNAFASAASSNPALRAAVVERTQRVNRLLQLVVDSAIMGGLSPAGAAEPVATDIQATLNSVNPSGTEETTPPATEETTVEASATPTPTSTSTSTVTPTNTATRTATATSTASPTLQATPTNTPRPTHTPKPDSASEAQPNGGQPANNGGSGGTPSCDERGNSCNSAGVPGGQIDPNAPPGQSGGRDEDLPDVPGQGNPGGVDGEGGPPEDNPGQGQGLEDEDEEEEDNGGGGGGNSGGGGGNSGGGGGNSGNNGGGGGKKDD